MLYKVWSLIFLLICAVIDLKEQKVFSILCFLNAAAALIAHIVLQDINWLEVLLGMVMGAIFFVVSVCTKECIGKGDGIVIFTLGSMMGIRISFQILVWAVTLCTIISLGGMVIGKFDLKSRIPFVPFLFVGGVIVFWAQGG